MNEYIARIAERTGAPTNALWALAGLLLAMVAGSIIRIVTLLLSPDGRENLPHRIGSLLVWWVLSLLLTAIVLIGSVAAVFLFMLASLQGLREFRGLAGDRIHAPALWWGVAFAIPVHYLIVYYGWFAPFWTFIPVWVLLALLVHLVVSGETEVFMETVGITFLGMMLIVFFFSHGAMILSLPEESNPAAGAVGFLVYLVILTEGNDIAQALWGRRFGKRKIAPEVSPNKSWEGFLLGAATTVILACLLGRLLTPFSDGHMHAGTIEITVPYLPALLAGVIISVGGFFGDIVISAVKREVGAKDSGTLLPGQGGVLDRIDSLTFTAPLFFYFLYVFCV